MHLPKVPLMLKEELGSLRVIHWFMIWIAHQRWLSRWLVSGDCSSDLRSSVKCLYLGGSNFLAVVWHFCNLIQCNFLLYNYSSVISCRDIISGCHLYYSACLHYNLGKNKILHTKSTESKKEKQWTLAQRVAFFLAHNHTRFTMAEEFCQPVT